MSPPTPVTHHDSPVDAYLLGRPRFGSEPAPLPCPPRHDRCRGVGGFLVHLSDGASVGPSRRRQGRPPARPYPATGNWWAEPGEPTHISPCHTRRCPSRRCSWCAGSARSLCRAVRRSPSVTAPLGGAVLGVVPHLLLFPIVAALPAPTWGTGGGLGLARDRHDHRHPRPQRRARDGQPAAPLRRARLGGGVDRVRLLAGSERAAPNRPAGRARPRRTLVRGAVRLLCSAAVVGPATAGLVPRNVLGVLIITPVLVRLPLLGDTSRDWRLLRPSDCSWGSWSGLSGCTALSIRTRSRTRPRRLEGSLFRSRHCDHRPGRRAGGDRRRADRRGTRGARGAHGHRGGVGGDRARGGCPPGCADPPGSPPRGECR